MANRLLLHAGALSERFSGEAAKGIAKVDGRYAALGLFELAAAIALMTEAAIEFMDPDLVC